MTEQELKKHYAVFSKALTMLQHPEKVTEKGIAICMGLVGKGALNRLFCLTVWWEVKLLKEGRPSLTGRQYKAAVTDVWRLFKQYCDGDGSDAYWDGLVEGLGDIMSRYGHC